MQQSEGFIEEGKENLVCKLIKEVYGLRRSERIWHQTLRRELKKLGFRAGNADPTVFFWRNDGKLEIAGWYVDNKLLAANLKEVKEISESFKIQDLSELTQLLGIKINSNCTKNTIHISQPLFINMITKHFDIQPRQVITSPHKLKWDHQSAICFAYWLHQLLCSLHMSWHHVCYEQMHAIHIPPYHRSLGCSEEDSKVFDLHQKSWHHLQTTHDLARFTDADFVGDVNDRKSTMGWVLTYNRSPLSWALTKQTSASRSSMESELIAGSFATMEGIWLIRLRKGFEHTFTPVPIFADNQSFIILTQNDVNNNCTKHIDTHYHYI